MGKKVLTGKNIRQDNRPYWLKRFVSRFVNLYVQYHLAPQFETLGERPTFMGAKYVDIFGTGINVGKSETFVATSDSNIRLTTWNLGEFNGKIYADDYCLFTPGVRIAAATEIKIGKGCMFANGSYISDADWHGIYKRAEPVGSTKKVELKDNVWTVSYTHLRAHETPEHLVCRLLLEKKKKKKKNNTILHIIT